MSLVEALRFLVGMYADGNVACVPREADGEDIDAIHLCWERVMEELADFDASLAALGEDESAPRGGTAFGLRGAQH